MKILALIRIFIFLVLTISSVFMPLAPGGANAGDRDRALLVDDGIDNEILDIQNLFLPFVALKESIGTTFSSRRINAPYFNVVNVIDEKLPEMAIAWFGQITPTLNYSDIRVGYNNESLVISVAIFDRLLWYDTAPVAEDFHNWDSVTLYLDLNGNSGAGLDPQAYRFDAQLSFWESRELYQAGYRGTVSGWETLNTSFETQSIWRGNAPDDDIEDRGWIAIFSIPFGDALGLYGHPTIGTTWGMGIALHDRDDAVGTPIETQSWPENLNETSPTTWGQLHFGLPEFTPPTLTPSGNTTIRHKLDGVVVQDAAVGGTTTNLCPGDSYFIWNLWGNMNFAGISDFNIQNQADVADWPCFSKYYVIFPLNNIPAGKEIISAKLTLYQFGNAGDLNDPDPRNRPRPSLIQVFSVAEEWNETTISWNNAPLALENISQAWASPLGESPGWPGAVREWDVSYGVEQAYSIGHPLSLVLYEADAARHSGKYFSSSDTGDWNENGRPTLDVTWGDP